MTRIDVTELDFVKLEPRGNATEGKYWVRHNGYNKLVKLNSKTDDFDIMELISSLILKELKLDCVDIELCHDPIFDKNGCLVTSFLKDEADILYEMNDWVSLYDSNIRNELNQCIEQVFNKYENLYGIDDENLAKLKSDYIKTLFGKCILENFDAKLENIGLVFNEKDKKYRIPPSFDNGFAFRCYSPINSPICAIGKQYFGLDLVVEYIMENFLDVVRPTIDELDGLIDKLPSIIDPFKEQLYTPKYQYIIRYINEFNEKTKEMIRRKL